MTRRVAVVLFNLGGPDKAENIRPFLFNFFMDKNIIRLPFLPRLAIATLISLRRSRKEAGSSYGFLGGRSPLLENTRAQAETLEQALNVQGDAAFKVYISMRYWHPRAREVTRSVKSWQPDQIVLLPLYPQYSTTTTRSSFQEWQRCAQQEDLRVQTSMICCYPEGSGFVSASADRIRQIYEETLITLKNRNLPSPRVLFSAHGLPVDIVKDGDPYQEQCERSAKAIVKALNIENLDWAICYQSRVGPKKWLEPSTEDELKRAASDGVPVIVYPHAFVSEHVETLVEIDIEYREEAQKLGVPYFARVPTVSTHPSFIADLAALVSAHTQEGGIYPAGGARTCSLSSKRCCTMECHT